MALSIERLLQCGPAAVICPAETDQQEFMRKASLWPEIAVRINLPANLVAGGDVAAIKREIVRLAGLAQLHPLAPECSPMRHAQRWCATCAFLPVSFR